MIERNDVCARILIFSSSSSSSCVSRTNIWNDRKRSVVETSNTIEQIDNQSWLREKTTITEEFQLCSIDSLHTFDDLESLFEHVNGQLLSVRWREKECWPSRVLHRRSASIRSIIQTETAVRLILHNQIFLLRKENTTGDRISLSKLPQVIMQYRT